MQGCQRSSTLISVIVYGTNRLHTPKPDILWNGYHFEKAVWCGDALRCQWWESGLVWYVCEVVVQSAFESVNWNMSGISDTNGETIPHPHWLVSEWVCFGISDPCCSISCDINRFDSPASVLELAASNQIWFGQIQPLLFRVNKFCKTTLKKKTKIPSLLR